MEEFVSWIESITVLELSQLVNLLEQRLGVTAAAPVAVAAAIVAAAVIVGAAAVERAAVAATIVAAAVKAAISSRT